MKLKCCYAGCEETVVGDYQVGTDPYKFNFCKRHKTNVCNSLIWSMLGVMELSDSELGLPTNPPDMKKSRFKITRHAAGKTDTTKKRSKKMSAKLIVDGTVTRTRTPNPNKQKKSKG